MRSLFSWLYYNAKFECETEMEGVVWAFLSFHEEPEKFRMDVSINCMVGSDWQTCNYVGLTFN